jgi:hypothetical protein
MPLKFWDEAFTISVYLINRTSNKVISYETPLERLFQTKPNYLALRVFGCACCPNLRPYNQHKLQFRSKQCAFLGYSNQHMGLKCLDISEGRVYVPRDVVFDETVYPFSKLNPNADAQLRVELFFIPSVDRVGVCLTNLALINVSNHHVEIVEPITDANFGRRMESNSEEMGENSEESGVHQRDFMLKPFNAATEVDFACEFVSDQTLAQVTESHPLGDAVPE